jgi:pimeloyl-ACP methyl ester carboxylesterase
VTGGRNAARHQLPATDGDLLLLHGLANTAAVWSGFVTRCRGWSPHGPDLPWAGEGEPGWSHRLDLPGHLATVIDQVPADDGLVVMAHSFSANLMLQLLDRELRDVGVGGVVRRLRGLVLVSPFYRRDPSAFSWQDLHRYLDGFDRIMAHGIEVQAGGRICPDLCREMGRRVRDLVGPYGWIRFLETYLNTPWLRLPGLRVPCLLITGERDFAAEPAETLALAEILPHGVTRVLPGCGHFPMSESPDDFADAVTTFLRALPPAGATAHDAHLHDTHLHDTPGALIR